MLFAKWRVPLVSIAFMSLTNVAQAQMPLSSCGSVYLPKTVTAARVNQPHCFSEPSPSTKDTGGLSRCGTACVTIPPNVTYIGFRVASIPELGGWFNPDQNQPDRVISGSSQRFCMPFLNWSHDHDITAQLCIDFKN